MRKNILLILLLLAFCIGAAMAETFEIKSTAFSDNGELSEEQVYNGFGCTGKNISPDLRWKNAPAATKSFALVVHDPDAPVPNGWYHWIVLNIPKEKTSFAKAEQITEPMTEVKTNFGTAGYGGACPPAGHGIHHYNFKIYALDTDKLKLPQNLEPHLVEDEIKKHSISSAQTTALYQR